MENLPEVLLGVVTIVFGWIGKWVVSYIKGNTKNKQLLMIEEHAIKCVQAVYQKTIKNAKKAYSDGKMSEDELKEIKAQAKAEAKSQLWVFIRNVVKDITGYTDAHVSDCVESAVVRSKAIAQGMKLNPSLPPEGSK